MTTRPFHWMHNPQLRGPSTPYKCGNWDGVGVSARADVTCSDCLALMAGVGTPTLHTPPDMDDGGMFTFYDVHLGSNYAFEVVPQTTGNVELTISHGSDGTCFTLSHLDRADLLRALLHDFHYSPERGGPNDN